MHTRNHASNQENRKKCILVSLLLIAYFHAPIDDELQIYLNLNTEIAFLFVNVLNK